MSKIKTNLLTDFHSNFVYCVFFVILILQKYNVTSVQLRPETVSD